MNGVRAELAEFCIELGIEAGNALAVSLGRDEADPPDTFNVPLYPIDGGDEPTHYGTSTPVTEDFEAMIVAAQQGSYPEWPQEMVALAQSVMAGLVASFKSDGEMPPAEHFNGIVAAHGLERREPVPSIDRD